MIAHLRGKVIYKEPNYVVVETGGVGYELTISIPTFSALPEAGKEAGLHVHTHVREDQLALFGFQSAQEKHLFEKLISVSGIGPKLAITVLSGMSAEFLVTAIRSNDIPGLTKIPGIGKKTAERMVLELRDKLTSFAAAPAAAAASPVEEDVLSALTNLGYQRQAAEKAIAGVQKKDSFEELFRDALNLLKR
jgi:Holliday junction DNA helicase RuvA